MPRDSGGSPAGAVAAREELSRPASDSSLRRRFRWRNRAPARASVVLGYGEPERTVGVIAPRGCRRTFDRGFGPRSQTRPVPAGRVCAFGQALSSGGWVWNLYTPATENGGTQKPSVSAGEVSRDTGARQWKRRLRRSFSPSRTRASTSDMTFGNGPHSNPHSAQ